jgi:RNA polymerase sigma-70 factor, ECF subfamily
MTDPSAHELVARLAGGDTQALADFYDRYAGIVNALALRILRRTAEAEDVVQEVFVQVWRQASRFDPARGTPEAWLFTITRTRALDRLRRLASNAALRPEASVPAPGSIEHAIAVRRALEELPVEQRTPLELAYYEGLTQSEIARRLDEPLGTIKTRMRTGMMRLRELLEPLPPS